MSEEIRKNMEEQDQESQDVGETVGSAVEGTERPAATVKDRGAGYGGGSYGTSLHGVGEYGGKPHRPGKYGAGNYGAPHGAGSYGEKPHGPGKYGAGNYSAPRGAVGYGEKPHGPGKYGAGSYSAPMHGAGGYGERPYGPRGSFGRPPIPPSYQAGVQWVPVVVYIPVPVGTQPPIGMSPMPPYGPMGMPPMPNRGPMGRPPMPPQEPGKYGRGKEMHGYGSGPVGNYDEKLQGEGGYEEKAARASGEYSGGNSEEL